MSALADELREAVQADTPVSDAAVVIGAALLLETQVEIIARLVDEVENLRLGAVLAAEHCAALEQQNEYLRSRANWHDGPRAVAS
jgi:hypothetical protein